MSSVVAAAAAHGPVHPAPLNAFYRDPHIPSLVCNCFTLQLEVIVGCLADDALFKGPLVAVGGGQRKPPTAGRAGRSGCKRLEGFGLAAATGMGTSR